MPVVRLRFNGQNGEDAILWRFFGAKSSGFYVDVGAFDGVYLSNTKVFEDDGWDGLRVEAHPEHSAPLNRNWRPPSAHPAVVGDGRREFELVTDSTGLFAGEDPDRRRVAHYFRSARLAEPTWETVRIPAMTLAELLDGCQPIDFLSLDIEGGEAEALAGLGEHRPRLLLIEANNHQERERIDDAAEPFGLPAGALAAVEPLLRPYKGGCRAATVDSCCGVAAAPAPSNST
jgi:FkbM family methyltransferase